MIRAIFAVLALLLVAGTANATYYDMGTLGGNSGYRTVIYNTLLVTDYLRAPAKAWQRLAFTQGSTFQATVYLCETAMFDSTTCTAFETSLTSTITSMDITTGRPWIIIDPTVAETAGYTSYITIQSNQQNAGSGGGGGGGYAAGTYGLIGAYMTPTTFNYMQGMKTFEGLDPSIQWTTYWVDPYAGADTNPGSYEYPIRTYGKVKSLVRHGARFFVKNGGRTRPMYFSPQTFPFPTGKTCVVGEYVTYTGGTSTILDIDQASGTIVFADRTGNSIAATNVITTASQSGATCAWTLGTRRSGIWAGNTALCQYDNTRSCTFGNRYTTTGCTSPTAGTCVAASESMVYLQSPTRYDGRITSYIDAENPNIPWRIHGNGLTMGELTNTNLGTNDDRQGVFIAGNDGSHGCFGVANVIVEQVRDDIISQHHEGCVRALNVIANRVLNGSNGANNNVITTHGGALGLGGVVSVNGGGMGETYDPAIGGAPIAPTGVAHMILIGSRSYLVDASNQGVNTSAQPLGGTGGQNVIIGHDLACDIPPTNGCQGALMTSSQGNTSLSLINTILRSSTSQFSAALSVTTLSNHSFILRAFKTIFNGGNTAGRAIFTQADSGALAIDVRGSVFQNEDFYWYDFTTNPANVTGRISGIYDEDTTNIFHIGNAGADYTTAASADAATPVGLFSTTDTFSKETAVTEYQNNLSFNPTWCLSTGNCFNSYTEPWSLTFPVPLYDYLPIAIQGYSESGRRNYGPR